MKKEQLKLICYIFTSYSFFLFCNKGIYNTLTKKETKKLTTINGIVNALLDKEIITETTGYSRNQIFAFEKYINLFLK